MTPQTFAGHSTPELLARYDRPGPRYTSYPTAVEFHEGVSDRDTRAAGAGRRVADEPLSSTCTCPSARSAALLRLQRGHHAHRDVAARYLDDLEREIDLLAAHLPASARRVADALGRRHADLLHWPSSSSASSRGSRSHFAIDGRRRGRHRDRPARHHARSSSTRLRRLGFNRLSMGVQDFEPDVQEAVNRVQSYEETRALVDEARDAGFTSINIDLIYGLPYQTARGFRARSTRC